MTRPNAASASVPTTCPSDIATITGTGRGSRMDHVIRAIAISAKTQAAWSTR